MRLCLIVITALSLSSCLHKVSVGMFPSSKSEIDYAKINENQINRNSNLKFGSKQEYCFISEYKGSEELLTDIITTNVANQGFKLNVSNLKEDFILFKKGFSPEAWKSMLGVYYDINNDTEKVEIYLLYQMTQDITGSFDFNYSEAIGQTIQYSLASFNK